jgi:hypothetical protein
MQVKFRAVKNRPKSTLERSLDAPLRCQLPFKCAAKIAIKRIESKHIDKHLRFSNDSLRKTNKALLTVDNHKKHNPNDRSRDTHYLNYDSLPY